MVGDTRHIFLPLVANYHNGNSCRSLSQRRHIDRPSYIRLYTIVESFDYSEIKINFSLIVLVFLKLTQGQNKRLHFKSFFTYSTVTIRDYPKLGSLTLVKPAGTKLARMLKSCTKDMQYWVNYSRMILYVIQISLRWIKNQFPVNFLCTKFGSFLFGFRYQHQKMQNLILGGVIRGIFVKNCQLEWWLLNWLTPRCS